MWVLTTVEIPQIPLLTAKKKFSLSGLATSLASFKKLINLYFLSAKYSIMEQMIDANGGGQMYWCQGLTNLSPIS